MKAFPRHSLQVFLGLVTAGAIVLGATGIVRAEQKTDPTVVVVRDTTPVGCSITYSKFIGNNYVPTNSVPCPVGTRLNTVHVPESAAIANHEDYVMLPSSSSSQAEKDHAKKQLRDLMVAIDAKYHSLPTHNIMQPTGNCTTNRQGAIVNNGSTGWDTNNKYTMFVAWDTHTDCSIYIYSSWVYANYIDRSMYWDSDWYAGWAADRGCQTLTNGYLSWNPNVVKNPGYYYEQWISSGSWCTVFDNISYYNLGPLND